MAVALAAEEAGEAVLDALRDISDDGEVAVLGTDEVMPAPEG